MIKSLPTDLEDVYLLYNVLRVCQSIHRHKKLLLPGCSDDHELVSLALSATAVTFPSVTLKSISHFHTKETTYAAASAAADPSLQKHTGKHPKKKLEPCLMPDVPPTSVIKVKLTEYPLSQIESRQFGLWEYLQMHNKLLRVWD